MARPTILLTGATGHIGFRTLVLALQAGYRVHVTTRSESQWEKIRAAESVKPFATAITFFVVPEIAAERAYDEAIRDVEAVIHLASPLATVGANGVAAGKTYQELLYGPAKQGTLVMMEAAAKTPSVKRVVITSSVAVLEGRDGKDSAGPYDIQTAPDLETANKITDPFRAYVVSKIMAHMVADDFVRENKVYFDLVRVLPGLVLGANELVQTREQMANGTNSFLMVLLEDVAKAHVLALRPEMAQGGENLVVAGNGGVGISWDDMGREVERQFPKEVESGRLKPLTQGQEDLMTSFDVESSEKALGFKFAGAKEMVRSVVPQYIGLAAEE